MKIRNLARLLAQRTKDWMAEVRRRKASDYGAILVGVAIMGAMYTNPSIIDDSMAFATGQTSPSPQTKATAAPTYYSAGEIAQQTSVLAQSRPPATPSQAAPGQAPTERKTPIQDPTPAPKSPEPTPAPAAAPTSDSRAQTSARSERPAVPATPAEQFVAQNADAATQSMQETGVPASVTLAQAILESDSGRSKLSTQAQNYFGIKATSKAGPAGVVNMDTWEHVGKQDITVSQPFRAYHSAEESFADHAQYLRENSRYAEAMKHTDDARLFAQLIHKAGYATDPAYSAKLIGLMDRYDLYQYDH